MKRICLVIVCLAGVMVAAWGCSRAGPRPQTARLTVSEERFAPLRIGARQGEPLSLLVTRAHEEAGVRSDDQDRIKVPPYAAAYRGALHVRCS